MLSSGIDVAAAVENVSMMMALLAVRACSFCFRYESNCSDTEMRVAADHLRTLTVRMLCKPSDVWQDASVTPFSATSGTRWKGMLSATATTGLRSKNGFRSYRAASSVPAYMKVARMDVFPCSQRHESGERKTQRTNRLSGRVPEQGRRVPQLRRHPILVGLHCLEVI